MSIHLEGLSMSDPKLRQRDDIVRKSAVRWLSPGELTSAGLRVGLSSAFGEYSDKREIEKTFDKKFYDYHQPDGRASVRPEPADGMPDPLWVDYVSDTGDGFAPTFAVAWMLAQEELEVDGEGDGETATLPRGNLLIHGGDLVYPTATTRAYEERFTGPYAASLPYTDSHHPHFYAIPGNHDWYDGLTSFIRKFCDGDWLGGRQLPQSRSYFSIKVSEHWWIWGIDIQFDGFIDTPQLSYFKEAAIDMSPEAGVILVTAKPSWAYVDAAETGRPTKQMHNLDFFLKECLNSRAVKIIPDTTPRRYRPKANVRMILAGDVHHYARYRDDESDITYLTAGGGGAYLSLTHHLPDEIHLRDSAKDAARPGDRTLSLADGAVYPSKRWSKGRRLHGILAGWRNPSFAVMLGSLYTTLAWLALRSIPSDTGSFSSAAGNLSDQSLATAYKSVVAAGLTSPGNIALFGGLTAFLIKFTRSKDRILSAVVGGMHGLAHMAGVFLCITLLSRLTPEGHPIISWFIYIVGFFIVGTFVGSLVYGVYLTLADFLGLHPNDLYASQRIEHKKSFLRMRITDDLVEVWAIGLDYVPPAQAWVPRYDQIFGEEVNLSAEEIAELAPDQQTSIIAQRAAKAAQDQKPDLELDPSKLRRGMVFTHEQIDYFTVARVPSEP